MRILDWILDLFLPRELKNLEKINEIGDCYNKILDGTYIESLKHELLQIDTVEHKEKVNIYLNFIDIWQKSRK
jgi:hypothetical protein